MMRMRIAQGERGAAAVEFALILPVLLLLVLGLIEFGRVYNVQISLTNAAREGARTMAIQNSPARRKPPPARRRPRSPRRFLPAQMRPSARPPARPAGTGRP